MNNISNIHEHCRGCGIVDECIEARKKLGITDQQFLDFLKTEKIENPFIIKPEDTDHKKECDIVKKMAENKPDVLPLPKKSRKPKKKTEDLKATDEEIEDFDKNFMQ